jgi:hypothetical protein
MIGVGRAYVVPLVAGTGAVGSLPLTNPTEIFYIKPAADKICVVEAFYLSNAGLSADAGDAQEELIDLRMLYIPATVTASSGGNAPTPQPVIVNDAAAGFTARTLDTTVATSSGTIVSRHMDGWNSRIPYVWNPPPEHRVIVANAAALTVRVMTGPADAIPVSGAVVVRELP